LDELKETFKLLKPISSYLYGYSLLAVPIIVNPLSLNLELKPDEMANSVLLIMPAGTGKTTLLHHILQKSNPKWFPDLPEKLFESQILQEPDDRFYRKVWVYDDLITTFRGTSTKQREQLMGFFNTFLTKGEYGRKSIKKKGRIVCLFGLAKEHYKEYGKHMFFETFTDRFIPVKYDFDEKTKQTILELRSKHKRYDLPTIRLPFKDEPIDVKLPNGFWNEINKLALMLDTKGIMSFVRAQTHIVNFVKASADLNGRDEVVEADLKLFKLTMPLYFGISSNNVEVKVSETILEASMEGNLIKGEEIKRKVIDWLGCSERRVQQVLSKLKAENIVFYKVSNGDFEYWI
jgi:hypothetical protein